MKVRASAGRPVLPVVYLAETDSGRKIEFVESFQLPLRGPKKWVLAVSVLAGCPVHCLICDAGLLYLGRLSRDEILAQIDFLVNRRFPGGRVSLDEVEVQFSRMGEPAFNPAVLDVLEALPARYDAPGLAPTVCTMAPASTDRFFDRLLEIKNAFFPGGRFQLQFSIHTTDTNLRNRLIPVKKWDFGRIARYGGKFHAPGDRKIALNFVLSGGIPVEPEVLSHHFDPAVFRLRMTPLSATHEAARHGFTSLIGPHQVDAALGLIEKLSALGYEITVGLGDAEENRIGSNPGQSLMKHLQVATPLDSGYSYPLQPFS